MFAEGEHANSTKKEPNKLKQRVALNETEMLHAPALSAHSLTIPALTAPTGHPFYAPSEAKVPLVAFFLLLILFKMLTMPMWLKMQALQSASMVSEKDTGQDASKIMLVLLMRLNMLALRPA